MKIQFSTLASEALLVIYKESDAALKKKLIEGALWEELKERVDFLTELSKELGKRNIQVRPLSSTPAESQVR